MSVYRVKIDDRTYEVVIENLHTRPIIARVDGAEIEVWPEEAISRSQISRQEAARGQQTGTSGAEQAAPGICGRQPAAGNGESKAVRAPIPGVVLSVALKAGEEVKVGQEVCVIEAMKMKNTIRSPRKGTVESIKVFPGQTVQHNDVLIEFTE